MLSPIRLLTTTAVIASLLLGATAARATTPTTTVTTTTRTTTSTTSTTLPPLTFSPLTKACIKHLEADKKICKSSGATVDCLAAFYHALPACFAPKGATAVNTCSGKKTSCDLKATTSQASCVKSCKTSPDPACKFSCATFAAVCKAAFTACLLKCPML